MIPKQFRNRSKSIQRKIDKVNGFIQGVTTHDIRCTKGLDIRLISGRYPRYLAVDIVRNIAVFRDFSIFLLSDH